jgi:H+/Cl- antiporter ClcA
MILDLPCALVLGAICGVLGAIFIYVAFKLGPIRKVIFKSQKLKLLECVVFAFVTSTCFYAVVAVRSTQCYPIADAEKELYHVTWTCPPEEYSPLASLVFNTEGGALTQFFRYPEILSIN